LGLLVGVFSFSNFGALGIASAEERLCAIEDSRVVCAEDAKDREAVFNAMADPRSKFYFKRLLTKPELRLNKNRRETFRKSLERNHRSMRRHANSQRHLLRRREISKEVYAEVRLKYDAAVETYKAALNVYRATVWYDPSAPPEDE